MFNKPKKRRGLPLFESFRPVAYEFHPYQPYGWYSILVLGVVLLDQLTKWLARTYLATVDYSIAPGFMLTLSWNPGISWGLLSEQKSVILITIIGAVLGAFLCHTILLCRRGHSIFYELLILAGGFSNLGDRIVFGHVIDFILLYAGSWSWPVFNIADICIVTGVCGIFYTIWRKHD